MAQKQALDRYETLALRLLRRELGPYVAAVTIREGVDHTDEPSLFFQAVLDSTAPDDLGRSFIFSHLYLREALEREGETRFPYLETLRPGSNDPTERMLAVNLLVGDAGAAKRIET